MQKKALTPFQQALTDAILDEYSFIPENENDIDIEFSFGFQAKMQKLIRKTNSKTWYYVNTSVKRAILVAIIAILITATVFASPSIRNAVIKIFIHDTGTHYIFTFDMEQTKNAPEHVESAYYPTYIPSGYTEVSNQAHYLGVCAVWLDADGWMIFYTQEALPHDPLQSELDSFNSEGTTISRITIDGYEIVRGVDDESIYYAWTNYEYLFTLICDNVLPEDELVKIFQSVQIDPNVEVIGAES